MKLKTITFGGFVEAFTKNTKTWSAPEYALELRDLLTVSITKVATGETVIVAGHPFVACAAASYGQATDEQIASAEKALREAKANVEPVSGAARQPAPQARKPR